MVEEKEKREKRLMPFLFLFGIIAIVITFVIAYLSFSGKSINVYTSPTVEIPKISVIGTAMRNVNPDKAVIVFDVSTLADNATLSSSENAKRVDNIKAGLMALGVSTNDIKTLSYRIDPEYDYYYECPGKVIIYSDPYKGCIYKTNVTGYRTTHAISVDINKIENAGKAIDTISKESNVTIQSISFTLKDETRNEVEKELLAKAALDAKKKAEKIAQGLSVSLGKPISVSTQYSYIPPIYYSRDLGLGFQTVQNQELQKTEVFSSDIQVSISISVTYEIK